MRCEKCRKANATFHVTTVVCGATQTVTTRNLCPKCARASGLWSAGDEHLHSAVGPLRPTRAEASIASAVRLYLQQLENVPPLTGEQERELFRRLKTDRGDDAHKAAAELALANLRHVVAIARKHARRGFTLLDLIQEGNRGLLTAMKRFDPKRHGRFAHYARPWIRRGIARAQRERAVRVRLTPELLELLPAAIRLQKRLWRERRRKPTARDLAVALNVPIGRARQAITLLRRADAEAAQE